MLNCKKTLLSISVGLVAILLLNSCGPSQVELDATATKAAAAMFATQTAEAPTSMPTSTNTPTPNPPTASPTSIPPTAPPTPTIEPLPGLVPEGIIATFTKKEECTISGPTELPTGEYTFVLRTLGELKGILYVSYLIDGKTSQDLLNLEMESGHYWHGAMKILVVADVKDGWRNESRNERYVIYLLEEGEHLVYRETSNPHVQWYCGLIWEK